MFNTEDEILRRLQEKNLEMAVMFYHWCQRNHLTCYLCGGGCIGAIRHGGFIPWDDDLDFFMPRKDYEKFLKIWDTQEESKIYKLEYPKEGFCNAHTFANIRDSRTTQVKRSRSIWISATALHLIFSRSRAMHRETLRGNGK